MQTFKAIFEIVEDNNCPLYDLNERFELSDKVLTVPEQKKVCLILVREITQLLFTLLAASPGESDNKLYTCSGCTGLIKFNQITSTEDVEQSKQHQKVAIDSLMINEFGMTVDCDLFQVIPPGQVKRFFSSCCKQNFKQGQLIVQKGEINKFLYIVLSGSVVVEDGPVKISHLSEGEIFGEMSYLGSSVAATSVRASNETVVLSISGEDFGTLLERSSGVQMFMAKLLAKRLSSANRARAEEFDSCMTGRINEMVPAELFQIFHMHGKTGVLNLDLSRGDATVSFREGCIINAQYENLDNQDAIFSILAEREGVYKFSAGLSPKEMKAAEIGDFMGLLMEGIKRIDEVEEQQALN